MLKENFFFFKCKYYYDFILNLINVIILNGGFNFHFVFMFISMVIIMENQSK